MTTRPAGIQRPCSIPVSWLLGLGTAVAAAAVWCFRKLVPEKKPLSRSQEKQRRKELVRQYNAK